MSPKKLQLKSETVQSRSRASNPTSGWPGLPTEIKLHILSYRLIFCKPLGADDHKEKAEKYLLPLLETRNRELALLAKEVYYKTNTFRVKILPRIYTTTTIRYPDVSVARLMHHLEVIVGGFITPVYTTEALLLSKQLPWQWILAPKEPLDSSKRDSSIPSVNWLGEARDLSWQTDFTNLKSLKIWVYMCLLSMTLFAVQLSTTWNA